LAPISSNRDFKVLKRVPEQRTLETRNTGSHLFTKVWWTTVEESDLDDEKLWLDEVVYKSMSASSTLPSKVITASSRYSRRAETFD